MRIVLLAAALLTPGLATGEPRDPAVVVVPSAEDAKDAADAEGTTTTYLVRDPYPGTETATTIERAMSALGWTLLRRAPELYEEHRFDGTTLVRFRMQAKDLENLGWPDIFPDHFATQVWTDSGGNVVAYKLNRSCAYEAAGMHSVYLTVRATSYTPASWKANRVSVSPAQKPTGPWP